MKNLEEWLEQRQEAMITDIARLVSIPSAAVQEPGEQGAPYGRECKEALVRMLGIGEQYGFEPDNCDGYCGSLTYGEGEREIGIWGHLDVVPAGEGWEYDPFTCTRKGDYLIGRGVQDNKGPLIAVLYAMRFLKESGFLPGVRFRLIFGCNEESGMDDAAYYLSHRRAPDVSFVADCGFPVCHGEKGICRVSLRSAELDGYILDIKGGTAVNSVPELAEAIIKKKEADEIFKLHAKGTAGHAAFPEGTENAVGILCRQLLQTGLQAAEKNAVSFIDAACSDGYGTGLEIGCKDALSGKLTCNLGVLNMEEGRLAAELDIRYPVSVPARSFLEKIALKADEAGFEIVEVYDDPPCYMPPEQQLVRLLMEAYNEETAGEKEPYVMGGGTYARRVPNAVGFGPGFTDDLSSAGLKKGHGGCHSADEAQSLSGLKQAIKIYVRAMRKLNETYSGG